MYILIYHILVLRSIIGQGCLLAGCGLCYHWRVAAMEINLVIDGEFAGCPDADWFRRIVEETLKAQGVSPSAEMGLVITDQARVQELNRTYRGEDRPTDVLAFYMTSEEEKQGVASERFVVAPDGKLHLGEVIISYPQAVIQAQERGHSVAKELAILIIHGVLHLLGYDHERPEQKREMAAREQAILPAISLALEGKND
jgi:probable rRNA maturation factor